jgi:FliI/YscN family ATPase
MIVVNQDPFELVHDIARSSERLCDTPRVSCRGRVTGVRGGLIFAKVPAVGVGDQVDISRAAQSSLRGEVIGFDGDTVTIAPYGDVAGVSPGSPLTFAAGVKTLTIPVDPCGMVLGALGETLEGKPPSPARSARIALRAPPPAALGRPTIREQLPTGIKAIDLCVPLGVGQRIGLFAPAGVGKSTLLGLLARNAAVDRVVIALVGERGREVQEFLEESLGPEGRARSVVVVSTSDESSLRRFAAAQTATAIAESYRAAGKRVLLLVDSLTRASRALREIGLAAGELPVRQGYTPSVFTELPRLLERPGLTKSGSITALYTVLTASEQESDPLAEEIKSILDGHLILSEQVAQSGVRPALDIVRSISRLSNQIWESSERGAEQRRAVERCVQIVAQVRRERDLLLLGGTPDRALQAAITADAAIRALLNQRKESAPCSASDLESLISISEKYRTNLEFHAAPV